MQATPASWRLLLEAGFRSRPGFKMLCGGEALPRDLANRLLEGGGALVEHVRADGNDDLVVLWRGPLRRRPDHDRPADRQHPVPCSRSL